MSQGANSARLTNTGVNIVGGVTTTVTNYGPSSIAVAGNNFDVSSPGTLVLGSTGSVTIGNAGAGAITKFNTPITLGPAPSGSTGLANGVAGPYLGSFYCNTTLNSGFLPWGPNNYSISNISITTPGFYIIQFALQITYSTAPTGIFYVIEGTNILNTAYTVASVNSLNITGIGMQTGYLTASTYVLKVNYATSGTSVVLQGGSYFQAIRIA